MPIGNTAGPFEKKTTIRLWGDYYVGTTLTNPSSPTVSIYLADSQSGTYTPTKSSTGHYYYDWYIPDDGNVKTNYVVEWFGGLSATDAAASRKRYAARTIYRTQQTQV
jgi:hypothetical protein